MAAFSMARQYLSLSVCESKGNSIYTIKFVSYKYIGAFLLLNILLPAQCMFCACLRLDSVCVVWWSNLLYNYQVPQVTIETCRKRVRAES